MNLMQDVLKFTLGLENLFVCLGFMAYQPL